MKQIMKLAAAAAVGAIAAGSIVYAQAPAATPRAIVSLYHAAPGQQEALLRWFAQQDRIATAAGIAPMQLYIHTDGDSWDYMGINPVTTEAQDQALDAAARKLGLQNGPRVPLELRKYITSHTDTFTIGPISAEQAVARLGR
jgi:hypothetical protein